jgi:polysaccharide chain length determinant protein (PEP-CTERM system associated)
MLGHRTLTLEDYLLILKRRWWIIAIPAVILPIIAVAISYRLTPIYTSQTLVLIEQQKVPDSYVKPVVAEDIDSRLASMQEQILSRSRLQPIIERFNLASTKGSMDDRIDAVRKAITIKTIHSEISGSGGLPGFFISFEAGDPHTAQAVCREITSLFLTENLRSREQSAEGTTEFLKEQLNDAKSNLDSQDAKLAEFQRQNLGALPDDQSANMNMLSTLSTQLDAATQAISRLEQERSYREALLAQQGKDDLTVPATPGHPAQHVSSAQATPEQAAELQKLQDQEADLTSRYTADYPDVVAVKRSIQDLKNQIAHNASPTSTSSSGAPIRVEAPAVQQLRMQISAIDDSIQEKRKEQNQIQRQIGSYQGRLQQSPLVAAKYKELSRDYQTAQDFYNSLLAKMNQSQMATDLERQQEGEQFRVMDDANLPDEPTFPKRGVFAAGGFAAGLALGALIVALIEFRDKALRTERDVWAFTKLPTLGIITLGDNAAGLTAPQSKWFKRGPKAPDKPLVKVGG